MIFIVAIKCNFDKRLTLRYLLFLSKFSGLQLQENCKWFCIRLFLIDYKFPYRQNLLYYRDGTLDASRSFGVHHAQGSTMVGEPTICLAGGVNLFL